MLNLGPPGIEKIQLEDRSFLEYLPGFEIAKLKSPVLKPFYSLGIFSTGVLSATTTKSSSWR